MVDERIRARGVRLAACALALGWGVACGSSSGGPDGSDRGSGGMSGDAADAAKQDGGGGTGGGGGGGGAGGAGGKGGAGGAGGSGGGGSGGGAGGAGGGAGSDATDAKDSPGGPPAVDECGKPAADWIFCDSFEKGVTYDGSLKTPVTVADPGPFDLAGNHAMQLRTPPGMRGGAGVWKSLPKSDRLYARWYVQWEPGYDPKAPHHGPGGLGADAADYTGRSGIRPKGDEYFSAGMEFGVKSPYPLYSYTYYRGMYQDCADPNGSCWGDSFPCSYGGSYCDKPADLPKVTQPTYVNGKWYCIEQLIDAGTPVTDGSKADGVLDFWVDGLQVGPWKDLWWRTVPDLKINFLWLYLFNHDGTHSVPGFLIDNVVVSKTRIGCPG